MTLSWRRRRELKGDNERPKVEKEGSRWELIVCRVAVSLGGRTRVSSEQASAPRSVPAVPENTRGSTGLPRRVLPSTLLALSSGMSEMRPMG